MILVEAIAGALGAAVCNALMNRRKPKAEPPEREKQCASVVHREVHYNASFTNERCAGIADNRCLGGSCTYHCKNGGCAGKCLE